MKRDSINYTLVGLFVTAMLLALIVALLVLTGRNSAADAYYADFANIAGIKAGTPVTYEGYEVGQVESIVARQEKGKTSYRLKMLLKPGWAIPADSRAIKISTGMLSPMVVEIKEGKSPKALAPGASIATQETSNMFEALTLLASQLSEVTDEGIKPLVDTLTARVEKLGDQLDASLPGTLKDLRDMLAHIKGASKQLEGVLSPQNQQHINSLLRNSDVTAANLAGLTRELGNTRQKLEKVLDETHGLVGETRPELADSLADVRQSLKRVNGILHQLENTGRNVSEFSRTIRENPSVLITSTPPKDQGTEKK